MVAAYGEQPGGKGDECRRQSRPHAVKGDAIEAGLPPCLVSSQPDDPLLQLLAIDGAIDQRDALMRIASDVDQLVPTEEFQLSDQFGRQIRSDWARGKGPHSCAAESRFLRQLCRLRGEPVLQ